MKSTLQFITGKSKNPQLFEPFQTYKKVLKSLPEKERPYFLARTVLLCLRRGKVKLARELINELCPVNYIPCMTQSFVPLLEI